MTLDKKLKIESLIVKKFQSVATVKNEHLFWKKKAFQNWSLFKVINQ